MSHLLMCMCITDKEKMLIQKLLTAQNYFYFPAQNFLKERQGRVGMLWAMV